MADLGGRIQTRHNFPHFEKGGVFRLALGVIKAICLTNEKGIVLSFGKARIVKAIHC